MVLVTSQAIIETQGLEALTARNIAAKIGYSVGTLYNLFANIDDIVMHLNGRTLDRLYDALALARRRGSPEADLKALANAYINFVRSNQDGWSVLFAHRLPPGQDVPAWYGQKLQKLLQLPEQALQPLFKGPGSEKSAARHARILWTGVHGICSLSAGGKLDLVTRLAPSTLANELVETYLAGLSQGRAKIA